MITEYHRPQTIDQALRLIARPEPRILPLGGGTVLNRPTLEAFAVADLQALGLDKIRKNGNSLEIGATATLQALFESPHAHEALKRTLNREATYNLRQAATVAGTLASAGGRSCFTTAMLALDAKLTLDGEPSTSDGPRSTVCSLGDLLPQRSERLPGRLITTITIPLQARLAFEAVARTPADRPIVCVALARWPSGRTRLALGGWGQVPLLAMDGNEPGGIEAAARDVCSQAVDERASAEYRTAVAGTLAKRCMETLDLETDPKRPDSK